MLYLHQKSVRDMSIDDVLTDLTEWLQDYEEEIDEYLAEEREE